MPGQLLPGQSGGLSWARAAVAHLQRPQQEGRQAVPPSGQPSQGQTNRHSVLPSLTAQPAAFCSSAAMACLHRAALN